VARGLAERGREISEWGVAVLFETMGWRVACSVLVSGLGVDFFFRWYPHALVCSWGEVECGCVKPGGVVTIPVFKLYGGHGIKKVEVLLDGGWCCSFWLGSGLEISYNIRIELSSKLYYSIPHTSFGAVFLFGTWKTLGALILPCSYFLGVMFSLKSRIFKRIWAIRTPPLKVPHHGPRFVTW
jgi:hypothetical protein